MKFSEYYQLELGSDDDWFDPIMTLDTPLFLDPFLLYADDEGAFRGSHDEVITFFDSVFRLIARSGGDRRSLFWRRAQASLYLHEVEELCLGYAGQGTAGAGSGKGFARLISRALWEAVESGLKEITHFEEVAIMGKGIGADRISDATAFILREKLADYTVSISKRHNVPLHEYHYRRGKYDEKQQSWKPLHTELPRNPFNGKAILLVPRRYLNDLPTVNADDFWDYCYSNHNEIIRDEYGSDISRNVSKTEIVKLARRHPELRRAYLRDLENHPPPPYNLGKDPLGVYRWYDATREYVEAHPHSFSIDSQARFLEVLKEMVDEFVRYVENNRGWELLWNEDGSPKRESAVQALFLGIVKHYCRANNIDISREADIGRGPVDFKVSKGYRLRTLLEVKLAKNTRFWHGLEEQLPKYLESEDIDEGYFLVVMYSDRDVERVSKIEERVREASVATGLQLNYVLVDARSNPPSASKL